VGAAMKAVLRDAVVIAAIAYLLLAASIVAFQP
jgi:hypothetical protein